MFDKASFHEQDETSLARFATGASMYVPREVAHCISTSLLKHYPDCGKESWKSMNWSCLFKTWTGHPADSDLEELNYPEHVELERDLVSLQGSTGGAACLL